MNPTAGHPAHAHHADAHHTREFGGWRDRGWHEIPPAPPAAFPAPPFLTILIPTHGVDSPDTLTRARTAVARLRDIRAAITMEDGYLCMRFPPGEAPIGPVAEALRPLGVTLDTANARTFDARFTPLTISAPPAPRVHVKLAKRLSGLIARARDNVELTLALAGGALMLAGLIVHLADGPQTLRVTLLALSAIATSTKTFPEALQSLAKLRVNIDQLMFAAAAGAAALGHYEEGAFLLFLFGLGAAGEHLALSRARRAINALASLAPDTAHVLDASGATTETPVENVPVGALVLVRPYDRIPLDADIAEGRSAIDESTITGESVPVDKQAGDPVFAGTMNTDAAIRIRVTRPSSESTLARVLKLVAEAQEGKSTTQLLTDRVERWYVPFVFIATACVLVVLLIIDVAFGHAFYRSMAFMTAASPCALAIGTPAAVLCAVARAARLGVLFKGGGYLDTLAQVRAFAYDKTGTLTEGKPAVTDVVPTDSVSSEQLLALAAAVESQVTHPLADAIVVAAKRRKLTLPTAGEASQIPGSGAHAMIDGATISVLKPAAVPIERWPATLHSAAESLASRGQTLTLVTRNDAPIGLIALADTIRPSAAPVVDTLRTLGVEHQIMLTGDNTTTANHIASLTHLDEIHAELLPDEKLERIHQLVDRYRVVAMVGDGVNDAPALAAASIGIAMGAAGADVAMETADVALMGASLENLPRALLLSRFARRIIRQNLIIALGVIAIVAPLGALGVANLAIAVFLHEGSTIVVVLNSLRLLRFRVT